MATTEQRLWDHYSQHKERWNRAFMQRFLDAKLPSYAAFHQAALLVAMGKSMDMLMEAVRDRSIEQYIVAQRENFRARVKNGISVDDIHAGIRLSEQVMNDLVAEALPDAPADCENLQKRSKKYLSLSAMALTELVLEAKQ